MSEKPNSRRDNFDDNKAAFEASSAQEAYENELYGNAGTTDFSDEARKRVVEASEYDAYMEKFASDDRSSFDRGLDDLEDDSYAQKIIESDPRLRRMVMMANRIAELRNESNSEGVSQSINDKEDKLNELLLNYSETENADSNVIDFIVNSTVKTPESAEPEEDGKTKVEIDDPASVDDGEEASETQESDQSAEPEEDDGTDVELGDPASVDDGEEASETQESDQSAEPEEDDGTDVELGDPATVDDGEVDNTSKKPSLLQRAKNSWALVQMRMTNLNLPREKSSGEDVKEITKEKSKQRKIALGAIAIVGAAAAAAVAYRMGALDSFLDRNNDISTSSGSTGGPKPPENNPFDNGQSEGIDFSPDASRVDPGEGFYQTFKEMNIPESEWNNLLQKAGPKLAENNWAYKMANGSWGISRPGQMPRDMLELIQNNR